MPKFHPTALIEDCWSSIGNITFFHRDGKCYYKRKPYTVYRGTAAQLDQAQVHHRAILAWQHQPHSVQLQWNHYARSVPSHRPPYDNNHHISGYNLFVSAYHGFAQLGREHVPEPQPFPEFPSTALELLDITPSSESPGPLSPTQTAVTLRCCLTLADTTHPDRWHLTARIQLTAPGVGCKPGLMRTYTPTSVSPVAIGPTTSTRTVTFTIKGPHLTEYQTHIKYCLIDDLTGFRKYYSL